MAGGSGFGQGRPSFVSSANNLYLSLGVARSPRSNKQFLHLVPGQLLEEALEVKGGRGMMN